MIRRNLYDYHGKGCRCTDKVHYYETTYEKSAEYIISEMYRHIANDIARAVDEHILRDHIREMERSLHLIL